MSKYGILLVSHASEVVEGVSRLIKQVASNVSITTAGGTEDNGVGTSIDRINTAISQNDADELLVFYDLGSAKMNLEMAAEFSEKPLHIYDTAMIESVYAAAALLQVNVDIDAINTELDPLKIK